MKISFELMICGILLFSLVQVDETRGNQPVEAHLELIQIENQITVVGEINSMKNISGARIKIFILRSNRSIVHMLLDSTVNFQAFNTLILKDLNNGKDITFSLEHLYGKYMVVMEISGGDPFLNNIKIEKEFQTELVFLKGNIPVDIPNEVPESQENQYYLPCCSSKVAKDLNTYFEFNWTEEQITFAAEKIKSEIYPRYSQGFSDLNSFLNDLNTILKLSLEQAQIDELVYALENGLFSPKTDAPIPHISDEIIEQVKHPSDSSAPFLTGRNVIARIYVNDPDNIWDANDRSTAWQQVSTAADQILSWAPSSANVSFVHVSFIGTLGETPDYSSDNSSKKWMEDVVKIFGYDNTDEFAKALKTYYNADHVIQLFLPHTDGISYALSYPIKGYGERACVFFYDSCFIVCIRNDEGPYKHETLHLYGACDEYYNSQCNYGCGQCSLSYDNYRSLYLNSGNCEYCTSNPVPCIMRSGTNDNHAMNDYICYYTRGQIGWGDYDGDSVLDPFDACVLQAGSAENYVCPSFGLADISSLFASRAIHVVGDSAYCTDVLGTANISWIFGYSYMQRPEGRTNQILPYQEHQTSNLLITGGPAVNPLAEEFGQYFDITYTYIPNTSFEIYCENKSIFLDIAHDYPRRDIAIIYLGRENERTVLLAWGYGWRGTYAASFLLSHPDVWSAYGDHHLLFVEWVDFDSNGLVTWNEIHVVYPYHASLSTPPIGSWKLDPLVFYNIPSLFGGNSVHVVGDPAYCTDVLGTANTSWLFGSYRNQYYMQRPEGRTNQILPYQEHQTSNLLITGGPAVNPLAEEFGQYFDISYVYEPESYFEITSDGYTISLDLSYYPQKDICIIYLGQQNNRNVLLSYSKNTLLQNI